MGEAESRCSGQNASGNGRGCRTSCGECYTIIGSRVEWSTGISCCQTTAADHRQDQSPNPLELEEDDIKRLVADSTPAARGADTTEDSSQRERFNFADSSDLDTDNFELQINEKDANYQELISLNGVYTGQVHPKTGKFHGLGVLRSPDSLCEGRWQDGALHGYGRQTWQDGRRYVGDFSQGKFAGKGKMEWPHPRGPMIYEGEYRNDRKHGEGKFLWPSGKQYQGQWADGRRHGLGVDTSPTGVKSAGYWQENILIRQMEEEEVSKRENSNAASSP
mmetsp:Transcript_89024/g.195035  ORF Transcript_89024/g.195035 Transcript_89024/m.195035 type:complete len:277 (-) Transcript_89024:535-1365(-)